MNFDKDELYEIEKLFDNQAGMNSGNTARFIGMINPFLKSNTKLTEYADKVLDEQVDSFNMYRMISLKARKMRLEGSDTDIQKTLSDVTN